MIYLFCKMCFVIYSCFIFKTYIFNILLMNNEAERESLQRMRQAAVCVLL